MIFYLLFYLNLLFIQSHAEDVELSIANGKILGQKSYTSGLNQVWYTFKGIPYAETPLRFEVTKEKAPWNNVINCTYDKPQCVQKSNPVVGIEDCLTLSVYTLNLTGKYPVFVWIHGGYLTQGNGSYGNQAPDFLVEEGIVFVEIQYRLGVFGFMSTEDASCPGNLGFKDQVLALQWVQKNIKYFGGDPAMVTLGGQSAGAVSTSLHLQSAKSKGLFHAMVLNSASSLCLWAMNRRARKTAFGVGAAVGVITFDSNDLVTRLKNVNYVKLQEASITVSTLMTMENPFAGIYYGYVPEVDNPDLFFTGKSEQMLSQGNFNRVPLMLGFTTNEATLFGNVSKLMRAYLLSYDLIPARLTPADLTNDFWKTWDVGFKIKDHFFQYGLVAIKDADAYHFISSDQFERPIFKFGMDVSQFVSDVYFYQFSHIGPVGGLTYRKYDGASHEEDIHYIFDQKIPNPLPDDVQMRKRMVRLWANFVKYHKPTPTADSLLDNKIWLPMRSGTAPGNYNYFNLNKTLDCYVNPKNNNMQFWINETIGIYKEYGDGNYDTY